MNRIVFCCLCEGVEDDEDHPNTPVVTPKVGFLIWKWHSRPWVVVMLVLTMRWI